MTIRKIGSLEIETEAKHPNITFFRVQKIGIVLMVLILLAAFFGVFGKGFLSLTSKTQGNLTVIYEKFIRMQSSTIYHIKINSNLNSQRIQFWIEPSFYKKISIKSMNPQPAVQEIVNDKIFYSFNTNQSNLIDITLVAEPEKSGTILTHIGLSNGEQVQLKQLIYP